MADPVTPYAGLTQPTVGADNNTWGGLINADLGIIDTFLRNIVPAGVSLAYRGSVASGAPTGWLFEDGSAVSRTTYAALFAVLGTLYGAGDGSTTFNLPDSRGRFTVGAGSGGFVLAGSGGSFTFSATSDAHVLVAAEIPSHSHSITDPGHYHTYSDPGHTHPVGDGGHTHGVNDPGHTHNIQPSGGVLNTQVIFYDIPGGAYYSYGGNNQGGAHPAYADSQLSNISIANGPSYITVGNYGCNISINGVATGINTTNALGGSGGHSHTLTNINHVQPYLAANRIIKT